MVLVALRIDISTTWVGVMESGSAFGCFGGCLDDNPVDVRSVTFLVIIFLGKHIL